MAHHIKVKADDEQSSSSSSSRGKSSAAAAAEDDDDEESLIVQLCPQFVWSVRDFTLQLDLDGKQATPDEYLERCLQEKPGKHYETLGYTILCALHYVHCGIKTLVGQGIHNALQRK